MKLLSDSDSVSSQRLVHYKLMRQCIAIRDSMKKKTTLLSSKVLLYNCMCCVIFQIHLVLTKLLTLTLPECFGTPVVQLSKL